MRVLLLSIVWALTLLNVRGDFKWLQLGADIEGEAADDRSGFAVSLSSDGNTVAIGTPGDDAAGADAGHVRVYRFVSGVWTQLGADIDGEAADDHSGSAVSLSSDGNTVAISANQNDGAGTEAGHVRVYRFVSGVWTQLGADIDGEAAEDYSGSTVSLSSDGNTLAIGAYGNDAAGADAGHVRVYRFVSGVWTQLGADIDGEAADDRSGFAVSLSSDGNTVAIGTPGDDAAGANAGHVRVYRFVSGVWTQLGADIDGEASGDGSGTSVSLSSDGNTVAIGAYLNHGAGTGLAAGHVRVYRLVSGVWTQLGADIDGDAAGDSSGWSVSLSSDGNTVAIGAHFKDGAGTGIAAGQVRVYRFISGNWTQLGADIDGEAAFDLFGFAVSLSSDGNTVAIGAYLNDGAGPEAGHVRVYDFRFVSDAPTQAPTVAPTSAPTQAPTVAPTSAPTQAPTVAPTQAPPFTVTLIIVGLAVLLGIILFILWRKTSCSLFAKVAANICARGDIERGSQITHSVK